MQNFEILEEAYENRRKKRFIKNTFTVLLGIFFVALLLFVYKKYTNFQAINQSISKLDKAPAKKTQLISAVQQTPQIKKQKTIQVEKQKPVVKPVNTVPQIESKPTIEPNAIEPKPVALVSTVLQVPLVEKPEPVTHTKTVEEVQAPTVTKKPVFSLQVKKAQKVTPKKFILRFNKQKNYNNAMKVANAFFINKDYKQAVEWALQANNLDKHQERSWLLFAKAQVALKNIKVAKLALENFLRTKNSDAVLKYYKKISHL